GSVLVSMFAQTPEGQPEYRVGIVYDMSFVDRRQNTARDYVIAFAGLSAMILALILVVAAWLLLRRWANILIRDIRSRRFLDDAQSPSLLRPILRQVRKVLHEIEENQRLEMD